MRKLTFTIMGSMVVAAISLSACAADPAKGGIDSHTMKKVEQHFSTGSKEPVMVSFVDNSITTISIKEANRIHDIQYAFRVTCGAVTILTDNLVSAQGTCKALQPNSNITISAA